ncbi:hypothetical protein HDU87_001920 [Geranomyces variabilis]|uniref:Uncharacterized protein n=1 Tax=Geranomyces variabilis TaxID=109894 RepID=A0AAD5XN57_9FUNG|nr:hypothetical protein HDU87_001920 [Geranomyces variabilis]
MWMNHLSAPSGTMLMVEVYKLHGAIAFSHLTAPTRSAFGCMFRKYMHRLQTTLGSVKVAPWMRSDWHIENGLLRTESDGGEYVCSHLMTLGRDTVEALIDEDTCRNVYHDEKRRHDLLDPDPYRGLQENEGFYLYDLFDYLEWDQVCAQRGYLQQHNPL